MTIIYTNDAMGTVLAATNDEFSWFSGQDGYVRVIATGQSMYLQHAGGEFPADVVAAARKFAMEIHVENERRIAAQRAGRQQATHDAVTVIESIPAAARDELTAINTRQSAINTAINEGGAGYAHQFGWSGRTGREILARHGMTDAQIAAIADAANVLEG